MSPATSLAADIAQAWELGELSWMLDSNQAGMYGFIHSCGHRRVVLNCSRRIGKTFLCVLIAIEFALKNKKAKIKFAASTADDLEDIIIPAFDKILETCPKHLRPKWKANKQRYTFPSTGAEIKLSGCDDRRKANRLRGTEAHLIVVEEAGSIPDLKYVVQSVLSPQLLSTGGMMLFASTPPDSIGHEFVSIAEDAEAVGAYLHRTIFDCPRYTKEQREGLFRMMCGKMPLEEFYRTDDFRREFMAELLSDQSLAVLKYATLEYVGSKHTVGRLAQRYKELTKPSHFIAYEGGDYGFSPDMTGWLFSYWHHQAQTLVIERELLLARMSTEQLAREVEGVEKEWLGDARMSPVGWEFKPPRRFADGDDRLFEDLQTLHGLTVVKTKKDDLKAAVNNVNLMIPGYNGALAINPEGCPELLRQMKAAIWDKSKKAFARLPPTSGLGHFDLVAALIYLARNVIQSEDPVPPGLGFNPRTQFRAQEPSGHHGNVGQLRKALGFGGRR